MATASGLPVAHRLSEAPDLGARRYAHVAELCDKCGLLQLRAPIPPEELYRGYNFCFSDWKAQPHVGDEVDWLRDTLPAGAKLLEIGCNDGLFLAALAEGTDFELHGVEPNEVAASRARARGVASIAEGFFGEPVPAGVAAAAPFHAIVARQTLEHVPDVRGFLRAAHALLEEGGTLLLEVPDVAVPLKWGDVSFLWEEHVNYFSEDSLAAALRREGFDPEQTRRYPFSGGALAVRAVRRADRVASASSDVGEWAAACDRFFADAEQSARALQQAFAAVRGEGRKNALYGSGCRANALLHLNDLVDLIDIVVDDQEEKQGRYMPGTGLVIAPSADLPSDATVWLSVNAENEESVLERLTAWPSERVLSLNAPSPRYWRPASTGDGGGSGA